MASVTSELLHATCIQSKKFPDGQKEPITAESALFFDLLGFLKRMKAYVVRK